MKYLLDANIIILALDGKGDVLQQRMSECDEGDMITSAVAFGEVMLGPAKGRDLSPERLRLFVEEVPVVAFDYKAALVYATLPFKRASFDRLIAAHAVSLDVTVVTDNLSDFADIPGLRVENWTK